MIRSAPICLAESTPRRPTAPSPTTATVMPGFTFAASAANQPVPKTSEVDSRLGIMSLEGTPGVADELGVLAGRLVARSANGTGVIGGEERTDNELAGLDRGDLTADFLDDAAVLVPHRARLRCRVEAAVGPQVGPAYAGGRHPDDRIRRLDDPRVVALLETHIARGVKNGSSHGSSPSEGNARAVCLASTFLKDVLGDR